MRIAYVCADPGIEIFGTKGASVHAREMIAALVGLGHQVTLLSPRIGTPAAGYDAVRLAALPALPDGSPETRAQAALGLNDAVRDALRAHGPFDLIFERHALYAHAAMEEAARQNIPGVLEINAPLLDESLRHRVLALPAPARDSTRRVMRAAGLVCAVSAPIADYARAHGALRVNITPNAVTPVRFPAVTRPEGRLTIGFLGTLRPWHDVVTLVRAMPQVQAELPQARLLIVGDGPERARLAPDLAQVGAELAGAVAPEDVAGWLAQMDIAVAPYASDQPFYFSPLKIYEYMASGLPVVASDVGDLAGVVRAGETGILCRPDDEDALARALVSLGRAPDQARMMGARGRDIVLRDHTWDGLARRIIAQASGVVATGGTV